MDRLRKSISLAKTPYIGMAEDAFSGIFRLALTPASLGLAQDDKRERPSIHDGILVTGIFLSIPHMRTGEGACATKR